MLQEFLEKLYKARQRLGTHIHRVNDIFQDVYTAVTDAQVDAAEAIKLLGISLAQPHSPLFKPIKLPKKDKMDLEGENAAIEDGSGPAPGLAEDGAQTQQLSGSLLPGVPTPTEAVAEQSTPEAEADIDVPGAAADSADGADPIAAAEAEADTAKAEEKAKEESGLPADSSLAQPHPSHHSWSLRPG